MEPLLTLNRKKQLCIKCFIQVRASRCAVVGIHNSELKIALTSPPVDGEANAQLIKFMAEQLKKSKSELSISSGLTSRHKTLAVANLSAAELEKLLNLSFNHVDLDKN